MTIDESRFEIASLNTHHDLSNHTLLVPCVSIGSVPQLAIDVLLEPSNASRIFGEKGRLVGSLDHRFCVPFLGGLPQVSRGEEGKSLLSQAPVTLYSFPTQKVTIIQQRSPIIKSRKHDYAQALMQWIVERRFSEVILLTSLDAGLRTDAQMRDTFWYYSQAENDASSMLSEMKKTLPKLQAADSPTSSSNLPSMPGGGLARLYLEEAKTMKVSMHALVTFAAEGDNRADAFAMATLLSTLFRKTQEEEKLREPKDWSLLFGSQVQDAMFN